MAFRRGRALLASAAVCVVSVAPALAQAPTPHPNQYGLGLIGAPTAWGRGFTGTGSFVAVADTGIDLTHPAFLNKIDPRSRSFVRSGPNAAYDANDVSENDVNGHGTHVAAIAMGAAATGVPGVAYEANVVVIRLLLGARAVEVPDENFAALNYFATDPGMANVRVYNASYGPRFGPNNTVWTVASHDRDEAAALVSAAEAGKIVVAANGNDRETNPVAGRNPNGLALYPFVRPEHANAGVYTDGGQNFDFSGALGKPGVVVAVASVGSNKLAAPYSNLCGVAASWCVSAPGGNDAVDPANSGTYSALPGGNYGVQQGTSQAAPHVSGALVALLQGYPAYNEQDVTRLLFATAENIGGQPGVNATYGYGLIRLDRATAPVVGPTAGAMNVGAEQTVYWSQPFTTAAFDKTGDGTLTIAGRTTATGLVTVSAGDLVVAGALAANAGVTVGAGGVLSGFGVLTGPVTVDGALHVGQRPNYDDLKANNGGTVPAGVPLAGTSPGTLTVQGNVTLGAGATHRVNVDGAYIVPGGPGTFDKLVVTGAGNTFTAGGQLAPVLRDIPGGTNTYTPPIGARYRFVTAEAGAGVAGTYAALTQPAAGLAANTRLNVVYAPTAITLSVAPLTLAGLTQAPAFNANQRAVAQVLDAVRPGPNSVASPDMDDVFDVLDDETEEEYDAALNSISGQGQTAMARSILNSLGGVSDVVGDRQSVATSEAGATQAAFAPGAELSFAGSEQSVQARVAGVPFPGAGGNARPSRWSSWGQVFGRWSHIGSDGDLPRSRSKAAGFVVGVDRGVTADLLFGAAAGFSRTDTSAFELAATTDLYSGALYATWEPGRFVLNARLAGGFTRTSTARKIALTDEQATPAGSYGGYTALAAADIGYRIAVGAVTVTPFVGVTAQTARQDAFVETTEFGLSFPARTFSKVTTAVGVAATATGRLGPLTIMPEARIAWLRDLRDTTSLTRAELFGIPFEVTSAEPGKDALALALKLTAWEIDRFRVYASYGGEFRENAAAHQLTAGFRYFW